MTMTLKQALAFQLPGGKTFGNATVEDLVEFVEFQTREEERYEALDPATMTAEDCQRMKASLDRRSEEKEAFGVIVENLPEDAKRKLVKMTQARQ